MSVVDGMARILAAAGIGQYDPAAVLDPSQTPIAVAAIPESPDTAVAVTTYPGGPEPDSRNGWEYPRLQVRVRALNPLDALDLDRACYEALQEAAGDLGAGLFLQDCYALQSEAQPLGVDANGRHEFTRNYQLSVARQ